MGRREERDTKESQERRCSHVVIVRASHSDERVRQILSTVLKRDGSLHESVVDVSVRERRDSWSTRDVGERLDGRHVREMFLKEGRKEGGKTRRGEGESGSATKTGQKLE